VGEQLEVKIQADAGKQRIQQEKLPHQCLSGGKHRQPVGQLPRSQQDAEGFEQGQVPQLIPQQGDGGEKEQIAHPVGQNVQGTQVQIQMEKYIAPGNFGQATIGTAHGTTSSGRATQ